MNDVVYVNKDNALEELDPSYPTIQPRTKCSTITWGDWELMPGEVRRGQQQQCVDERKLPPPDPSPSNPDFYAARPEDNFELLKNASDSESKEKNNDSLSSTGCMLNIMKGYDALSQFCIYDTGDWKFKPVDFRFLIEGCDSRATKEIYCQTNDNKYKKHEVDFKKSLTGLFFCGNDGVKYSECEFNVKSFLSEQHGDFVRKQCDLVKDKYHYKPVYHDRVGACVSHSVMSTIDQSFLARRAPALKAKGLCKGIYPDDLNLSECTPLLEDPKPPS